METLTKDCKAHDINRERNLFYLPVEACNK